MVTGRLLWHAHDKQGYEVHQHHPHTLQSIFILMWASYVMQPADTEESMMMRTGIFLATASPESYQEDSNSHHH